MLAWPNGNNILLSSLIHPLTHPTTTTTTQRVEIEALVRIYRKLVSKVTSKAATTGIAKPHSTVEVSSHEAPGVHVHYAEGQL